jgi:hypothetical protein
MNEVDIKLYKLLEENESHIYLKESNDPELVTMINFYNLDDLVEIVGDEYFHPEGINVIMQDGYIVIDVFEIIEYLEHDFRNYGECFEEWKSIKGKFK